MRTVSVRMWSLAVSTTPGATDNGFCLKMRRTSGAGHREAVAESIELLGIDAIDAKTAFQQGFDDRALGHFDGHPNDLGCGAGAGNQPIAQLLDPRAAMRNGSLAQTPPAGINQAN